MCVESGGGGRNKFINLISEGKNHLRSLSASHTANKMSAPAATEFVFAQSMSFVK